MIDFLFIFISKAFLCEVSTPIGAVRIDCEMHRFHHECTHILDGCYNAAATAAPAEAAESLLQRKQ